MKSYKHSSKINKSINKSISDKYGQSITINSKVAFNWCGAVCIGRIKEIQSKEKTNYFGEKEISNKFIIEHSNGGKSTVKNVDSLVVI